MNADGAKRFEKKLDVQPSQCILIGDFREDVGAARNAGMLTGHLTGGQHSTESMSDAPADLEIDKLSELNLRILPLFNKNSHNFSLRGSSTLMAVKDEIFRYPKL